MKCMKQLILLLSLFIPYLSHAMVPPLHQAVFSGNIEEVQRTLDQTVGNEKEENVQAVLDAALLGAVKQNNDQAAAIVGLLIERGANVNAEDVNDKWTPLHQAAFKGYEVIAKLLLDAGADLNAQTRYGWKPLTLAERNTAVAELLKNWSLKKQGELHLEELVIPTEESNEENLFGGEERYFFEEENSQIPRPANESWFSQFNNRWVQGGAGATAIAGLAVLGYQLFKRK